jgi:hypothetical protein
MAMKCLNFKQMQAGKYGQKSKQILFGNFHSTKHSFLHNETIFGKKIMWFLT